MNPFLRLLLVSLAAGGIAFAAYYGFSVKHDAFPMCKGEPEMEWLRREYHLDDAQYARVRALHADYRAECDALCARVASQRAVILRLAGENREVTPQLSTALREMSALEQECRAAMMTHVYTVAAAMNPADGRRYIETITKDIVAGSATTMGKPASAAPHHP